MAIWGDQKEEAPPALAFPQPQVGSGQVETATFLNCFQQGHLHAGLGLPETQPTAVDPFEKNSVASSMSMGGQGVTTAIF